MKLSTRVGPARSVDDVSIFRTRLVIGLIAIGNDNSCHIFQELVSNRMTATIGIVEGHAQWRSVGLTPQHGPQVVQAGFAQPELVLRASLHPQMGFVHVQASAGFDLVLQSPMNGAQKLENRRDPPNHGGFGNLDTPALELAGDAVERQVIHELGQHDPHHQVGAGNAFVDHAHGRLGLNHTTIGAGAATVFGANVTALDELGRNDVQLLAGVGADADPILAAAGADLFLGWNI